MTEFENNKLNKFVIFKYSDDSEHKVCFEHAKISDLVNDMMKDYFNDDNSIQEEILPLSSDKVNPSIILKIIDFMQHFHNEPMKIIETPIKSFDLSDLVQEYYVNFVYGSSFTEITEEQVRELREIILAANFLSIEPLLKLTLIKMGILTEKNTLILEKAFKKQELPNTPQVSNTENEEVHSLEDV